MQGSVRVIQTSSFARTVKKLSVANKAELDLAIKAIVQSPLLGQAKVGDLAGIRVHKFSLNRQQVLLAYEWLDESLVLVLLKLGSHENFYRDLKK
ncbi:MAG: type II toxin-antitoxin system RelE/ParE family toxin [Moraxellaceae bacterium]|nr:type II toxin-antitoxin system RelE/ParE family toxin [Moraxellaceae bacterium]MDZ4297726.1 type II toxin-antitoxin system RelE/ParE family toxin [Moraxellaceae bacterium]MDZ4385999.1 type II toxin-antitoxin system RelE/ParE family toxin [Moraxellaceae bacterium]